MLRATLTLSAVYLAIVGLALMLVPLRFGVGAVPPDAPGELIALLRLLGGPFLGIAVLTIGWSRDLDRSGAWTSSSSPTSWDSAPSRRTTSGK